mgnify:CR=1 FL=1
MAEKKRKPTTVEKRTLTITECTKVVDLYQDMLACRNQSKGERLADQIDEIIRPATYASFEIINRLIHQRNLPMMMKGIHIPPPPEDKFYKIIRTQIGGYTYAQPHQPKEETLA